ncbi:hypothetical protein [Levilactobacillus enshiensis]|uniref:hypothetical protein n=1 Tax=Levilactobacillus enshiensis TaxID=2590213 RepID=UPI00117B9D69|nr:hypothetical protein [Levilactobacillus enshiensis]
MKLLKATSILLAATTFGASLVAVAPAATAHAANKTMLKAYPKNMRRTWYRYEKGHYVKERITAKTNDGDKLHYVNPKKKWPKVTKKNRNWIYAFRTNKGVVGTGPWWGFETNWESLNDVGSMKGEQVVTKTYQGKKVKVLKEIYSNSAPLVWGYSYPTKQMAKHFNPKGTVLWS